MTIGNPGPLFRTTNALSLRRILREGELGSAEQMTRAAMSSFYFVFLFFPGMW